MICILAIDPGITGALAFYFPETPDRIAVEDMPILDGDVNPHALRDMIDTFKPTCAMLERVAPRPKEGVSGVWRFAASYTMARAVVSLMNIPITLVTPGVWKKAMGLGGGKEGKEIARARAIQTFPSCAASFSRKKDHNRADAAMLALYAARQLKDKHA